MIWEILGYIALSYLIMWQVIQNKEKNGLWKSCLADANPEYECQRETVARQTLTMIFISSPIVLPCMLIVYVIYGFLMVVHKIVNRP